MTFESTCGRQRWLRRKEARNQLGKLKPQSLTESCNRSHSALVGYPQGTWSAFRNRLGVCRLNRGLNERSRGQNCSRRDIWPE